MPGSSRTSDPTGYRARIPRRSFGVSLEWGKRHVFEPRAEDATTSSTAFVKSIEIKAAAYE
jgi:hypothetical protein